MSELKSTGKLSINITLTLNEVEARAIHALTFYGHKQFLEGYYKQMGRCYMQPHESGLISLFETIKEHIPKELRRADKARIAFCE